MPGPLAPPAGLRDVAAELDRARGDERSLRDLFEKSPFPMVMIDGERRYVDANRAARLIFHMDIEELRSHVVDDLTAPSGLAQLEEIWERFIRVGRVTGTYPTETLDGSRLEVAYYAIANALPGRHVGVFAPAHWPEGELAFGQNSAPGARAGAGLTARETEVLGLAARGLSGPEIAKELVLSADTVKNHFANIRAKLGVSNRAAAVAKAIHLRLID